MRRSAKRTLLAAIALGAGGAAVGGFGAAIGRDVWRTAKKLRLSLLILVILGAVVVLPFLGGRNLTRGYPKWEHVPFGSSILLIFAGALPILLFVQPDTPWEPEVGHLLVFLAFPVVLGMLYGASQSGSRVRRFEIEEHNQQFLEQFGFPSTAAGRPRALARPAGAKAGIALSAGSGRRAVRKPISWSEVRT